MLRPRVFRNFPACPAKHAARAAFSLVELSVVIVIISVVAVMGLEVTASYMDRTAHTTTTQRLEAIDRAMMEYRRVNNKLPCPAYHLDTPGSSCYGKERNGSDGAGTCNDTLDTCTASTIGGTTLFYGSVPARDLGLPLSTMADGYGSRIWYVVSGDQVYNETYHATNNFVNTSDQIVVRSGKLDATCGGGGELCQNFGGTSAADASYFIFSAGRNKRGAFQVSGVQASTCLGTASTTTDGSIDSANCRFGTATALKKNGSTLIAPAIPMDVFYDSRYNAGSQESSYFDDLVRWRAKNNL